MSRIRIGKRCEFVSVNKRFGDVKSHEINRENVDRVSENSVDKDCERSIIGIWRLFCLLQLRELV